MLQYLHSLKILCISNHTTLQYKALLEEYVGKVYVSNDLEILDTTSIDIVIFDYEVALEKGVSTVAKIREHNKVVPIIVLATLDDVEIVTQSLHLGVHGFVQKPIHKEELLKVLHNTAKIMHSNSFLGDKQESKLLELENMQHYNDYQEDLAFSKELNILRNDFYYQTTGDVNTSLVDFWYQPLDAISGDAYSARHIDANRTFYLIVDGMGKGLSASLTAMIMTSFVNHLIDKMIEHDSFSLEILVRESMSYIQPILLDAEALAIDYIVLEHYYNKLQYAKFAMPPFLLQDSQDTIIKIKSNNPPMSKWQSQYSVDEYDITDVDKFLFYSDGIVENSVHKEGETYAQYIEDDFKNSFSKQELKTKIFEKITQQEDDLSMIFINKLDFENLLIASKIFESSLDAVDNANEWYTELWEGLSSDTTVKSQANLVFTELFMNAYEHGSLGLKPAQKHLLLEEDTYFETLLEMQKNSTKKIRVEVAKIQKLSSSYIVTKIKDEGEGFDTQILSEIFRNSQTFNGRGVFVSRKNSMGIYFNSKGNSVLFLNKI